MDANSPKKNGKRIWVIVSVVLVLVACCASCVLLYYLAFASLDPQALNKSGSAATQYSYLEGNSDSKNKILVIPVSGVIYDEKPQASTFDLFALEDVTYGYEVKSILEQAAQDSDIAGVLLKINSPGGTITGSKAIADGVEAYRAATGKPVYAHIIGMGASGGYWTAASADFISSDPGSLVGSIGVIFGPFKYYKNVTSEQSTLQGGVTADGGIETYYITSGTYKDFGSPYRPMSAEEMAIMQADTDHAYDDFVNYISKRRNISEATIRSKIMSLPYGEAQALTLGLIDKVLPVDDSIEALAETAGLNPGDYQLVGPGAQTDFWSLLFASKLQVLDQTGKLNGRLLYLYGYPESLQKK